MGKRIFWSLLLLVAIACGWFYLKHHQEEVRLASGDVSCDGCMTPEEHKRFLKENAGDPADGQSERKIKTARQEAASDFQDGNAASTANTSASATGTSSAGTSVTMTAAAAGTPANLAPAAAAPSTARESGAVTNAAAPGGNPPTGDSLAPNAPNGAVFAGKGTYQWYRQGNLTWRIDTASGRSCIIYATMEEWRKQIVYSHGCGRSA